jgi:hypothetical protein
VISRKAVQGDWHPTAAAFLAMLRSGRGAAGGDT